MSFVKSKIVIEFRDGTTEIHPCFKILAPLIADKYMEQQGDDILRIDIYEISNDEYRSLCHLPELPPPTSDDLFRRLFWDSE